MGNFLPMTMACLRQGVRGRELPPALRPRGPAP